MAIWKFEIKENTVRYGEKTRRMLTSRGCNEPFKGRHWCPKKRWFLTAPCPFVNQRECENYQEMCGSL